jgi:hypothetical protein
MKKLSALLKKEFKNFRGSERGVFIIYIVLVLSWSFLPLYSGVGSGSLWWLFFSVVISGNFANTVFVAERLNGSMEILLTSGFRRTTVLSAKLLFVMSMSMAVGALCFGISLIWVALAGQYNPHSIAAWFQDAAFYIAGICMNVTCGAWMSIRLQSPRIIPFLSLLFIGILIGIYYAITLVAPIPQWTLLPVVFVAAVFFYFFARKDFHGEKIIAPLHL